MRRGAVAASDGEPVSQKGYECLIRRAVDWRCVKPDPERAIVNANDLVRGGARLQPHPESYGRFPLFHSDWAHRAPITSLDSNVSAKYATIGERSIMPRMGGIS